VTKEDLYSFPCNLLTGHPRGEFASVDLEEIGRPKTAKQIEGTCDQPCPTDLVAGSKTRTAIPMEVLVKKNVISPMRIFLKLLSSAVDWPFAAGVAEKDTRESTSKLLRDLIQRGPPRARHHGRNHAGRARDSGSDGIGRSQRSWAGPEALRTHIG
jgi:hypothetical protein